MCVCLGRIGVICENDFIKKKRSKSTRQRARQAIYLRSLARGTRQQERCNTAGGARMM
jgi:hypothetical protein